MALRGVRRFREGESLCMTWIEVRFWYRLSGQSGSDGTSAREESMATIGKEACFEGLAPEAKAFLDQVNKVPRPTLSMTTYKGMRRFVLSTVEKIERPRFRGRIEDRTIPGRGGDIPVRICLPEGNGPFPVLLYFHGGAWALGNLDTEEDTCLALTRETPCIVISVDYRLAPEHPFPAALEDCYAVLRWAAEQGAAPGGDGGRIAVSGESAGGNLAAAVALMSRDLGGPAIMFQALFCPVTNVADFAMESQKVFSEGFFIGRMEMEAARALYVPDESQWANPYVSPLLARDLSGLPPALIVTAGCDPLRDEGEAYAARLQAAGVRARYVRYEDMIHAFLFLLKSSESRRRALEAAAGALREAFLGACGSGSG